MIQNEFLKVEVEQESGAIVHLVDKRTGVDLVPAGERLGLLEYVREAPHGMRRPGWCRSARRPRSWWSTTSW